MPEKMRKGFAVMTPEQRRVIASKGGKALAPEQRSFSKDRSLASAAGKVGGLASQQRRVGTRKDLTGQDFD
jgi:general stress protein YciG